MKTRWNRNPLFLAIAFVILLILTPFVAAQDVTPPAEATSAATVEQMPVTIVPTPTSTPTVPTPTPATSDPMITLSIWQIIAGFATAFSLGGLTIGTGVAVLAYRLRTNPTTMAAIEYLAKSTPESTTKMILTLATGAQYAAAEVGGLVREALDGKPASEKTPEERKAVLYAAIDDMTTPTKDE